MLIKIIIYLEVEVEVFAIARQCTHQQCRPETQRLYITCCSLICLCSSFRSFIIVSVIRIYRQNMAQINILLHLTTILLIQYTHHDARNRDHMLTLSNNLYFINIPLKYNACAFVCTGKRDQIPTSASPVCSTSPFPPPIPSLLLKIWTFSQLEKIFPPRFW